METANVSLIRADPNLKAEIIIENGETGYIPEITDIVTLATERKGTPGKLEFTVLRDALLNIEEGNPVSFKVGGKLLFYGFIFALSYGKGEKMKVTAYDQMRYLLNKDTYLFEDSTASQILRMICADYGIRTGEIEETEHVIPSRVMDNKTLLDMIQDGLEITLTNTGELYCLYDDAGALTLRNTENLRIGLLVDPDTAEDYDFSSGIDSGVYNVIKLAEGDDGIRNTCIVQDEETQKKWGSLQYFEKIDDAKNAENKARIMLSLYNVKKRSLSLRGVTGDIRVRAGCMVLVGLPLHDTVLSNWMLVESCTHTFREGRHTMSLKLRGGMVNG